MFNGELMQIETEDAFKQPAILIWLCHVLMVVLLARAAPTLCMDSGRIGNRRCGRPVPIP